MTPNAQLHRARLSAAVVLMWLGGCAAAAAGWSESEHRDGSSRVAGAMTQRPLAREPRPLPADAALDDYIRYAMQHSPALAAAYQRWRAALARVPQATSLPDPQIGFEVVLDEVDRSADYMGERYSISQMFPWFGKLKLRGDIATEQARAEEQRFEAVRLELADRITGAWFEHAWLHQAAATARDNRDLMQRLESVARSRFRTGAVTQADVNRAQVELGRLDDQARSLEDMLGPAAVELNALLGRAAHAPLPGAPVAPSRQVVQALPERDDEQWLQLARQGNPGLAASRHEVTREQQSLELARREYYPDIMLGVQYARDGSARMAMMDGGGADMVMGMVSINLPLRRGRYDAGVREARARMDAAAFEVEDRQAGLDAALKGALFTYRDSARRISLYGGTLVPTARQAMATTEIAYRTGAAGFTDLVDAQRVLLEFELAHERAAADRGRALARIRALVGATGGDES